MSKPDIRWKQRFENYRKAVAQMTRFIEKGELNEMEEQGLIQSFEYTYELAWNTLKDFFEDQGEGNLFGSRDVFRLAFKRGLFEDGETWMKMIESRALTSHTYNEETAKAVAQSIRSAFFPEFVKLRTRLETLSTPTE
ncbi:MAG: nucleotidyltransferase substrate binding protein [Verrucomicrobiaceae bacterium]|jgi:nucleotidyltransferase substrate binding protein (TIGR01987 family)|nr:nucleotidyltransferase substrate binding protein [Verrucomicrobiaceae bacterium]